MFTFYLKCFLIINMLATSTSSTSCIYLSEKTDYIIPLLGHGILKICIIN